MPKSLYILVLGAPIPMVKAELGGYDRWFQDRIQELPHALFESSTFDATQGELPLTFPDALILTGSPHSVYEPLPWLEPARAYVRSAIRQEVPVLGVCFGHQLLAELLGGKVGPHPRGYTLGTVASTLTSEGRQDPLFEGQPAELFCHETHGDVVLELPPGASVLATAAHDPHHALRLRERVWSVQFHPEMREFHITAEIASLSRRFHRYGVEQGLRPGEFVLNAIKSVREEDDGLPILQRWLELAAGE